MHVRKRGDEYCRLIIHVLEFFLLGMYNENLFEKASVNDDQAQIG